MSKRPERRTALRHHVIRLRETTTRRVNRVNKKYPGLGINVENEECLQKRVPRSISGLTALDEELMDLKTFCEHYLGMSRRRPVLL